MSNAIARLDAHERWIDDDMRRDVRAVLHGDRADDDEVEGGEIVRAYMLTRGRTRATSMELPIETVVCAPLGLALASRVPDRDQRRIQSLLIAPMSIAEISAHLAIPLRAAVVLVSEMAAAGLLTAGATVDRNDVGVLLTIRSALQIL